MRATRQAELAAIAFDRPFDQQQFIADLRRVRGARRDRARARAGGLAPPEVRSRRHHGRRVSGRARPAGACRRSRRPRHHDRRRRSRAWSRSAGRSRSRTTTRRCAARRCGCDCCSIVPRTSSRPAISRCSPAASDPARRARRRPGRTHGPRPRPVRGPLSVGPRGAEWCIRTHLVPLARPSGSWLRCRGRP